MSIKHFLYFGWTFVFTTKIAVIVIFKPANSEKRLISLFTLNFRQR